MRPAGAAGGRPLVYLPPSSPDLTPITQGFATRDAHLHAVASRTFDVIGTELDAVSTADVIGC